MQPKQTTKLNETEELFKHKELKYLQHIVISFQLLNKANIPQDDYRKRC